MQRDKIKSELGTFEIETAHFHLIEHFFFEGMTLLGVFKPKNQAAQKRQRDEKNQKTFDKGFYFSVFQDGILFPEHFEYPILWYF